MTSSVQPPILNPPLGTPSSEWAKKTTSPFDQPSQATPQNTTSQLHTNQSPAVTPGNELPGAFPNRGQEETSTGTTNITETIVDTAKQYLPTGVMNKVETLLGKPLSLLHTIITSHTGTRSQATTTPLGPREPTNRLRRLSTTSIIKPLSPRKNCVEPYLMNASAVWAPFPGLQSRRASLSFQTSKQIGQNGAPLPDVTPLVIKLRATVSPPLHIFDSTPLTSPQSRRTPLALAKQLPRRRPTSELPRAFSRLTFRPW